jgi:hypothetical protein
MHAADMIVAQLFWLDREHLPDFIYAVLLKFLAGVILAMCPLLPGMLDP